MRKRPIPFNVAALNHRGEVLRSDAQPQEQPGSSPLWERRRVLTPETL